MAVLCDDFWPRSFSVAVQLQQSSHSYLVNRYIYSIIFILCEMNNEVIIIYYSTFWWQMPKQFNPAVAGLCRCVVDKVEPSFDGRAIIFEINAFMIINRNWIDQNEKPHTKWNAINVGTQDPRNAYALIMKIFMIIYSFIFFSFCRLIEVCVATECGVSTV